MNRRHLVVSIAAASLAGRAAMLRAQPAGAAMPRIGVLSFGTAPSGASPDPSIGFRQGLRELGMPRAATSFSSTATPTADPTGWRRWPPNSSS